VSVRLSPRSYAGPGRGAVTWAGTLKVREGGPPRVISEAPEWGVTEGGWVAACAWTRGRCGLWHGLSEVGCCLRIRGLLVRRGAISVSVHVVWEVCLGRARNRRAANPGARRALAMTCSLPPKAPAACGGEARSDSVMAGCVSHAAPPGPAGAHGGGQSEGHSRDSITAKPASVRFPPPSEFRAARRASRAPRRLPGSL
jgi:hypothetical protein